MSDRIGEDVLLDVGCFLDRFDVDSIQCLSRKSHKYLANKSHILPMRLLERAHIGAFHNGEFVGFSPSVSARDPTRGTVDFNGQQQESFQLALAAIKHSDIKRLELLDLTDAPITGDEGDRFAAIAATVRVTDVCVFADLTHLSPGAFHRLLFSFSFIKELTLHRFTGSQVTEEHLRERGRRHMWSLRAPRDFSDNGSCAFGDEALLDYLYAPEGGMHQRSVCISSFNASPLFIKKLISRAQQAANIGQVQLYVRHLPLQSQELGGLDLFAIHSATMYFEMLENGRRVGFQSRVPVNEEEAFQDNFCFINSE